MNKDIKNKIKEMMNSKAFTYFLRGFGAAVLAVIIFQAGVFVGFHKASFGRDFGDNYMRNFGPSRGHGMPMMKDNIDNFPNSHGAVGKIIKIELPSIIVSDKDGTEKIVNINDDTKIRSMRDDVKSSDLKVDSFVVVIGTPNSNGQIEAKFIRVMPSDLLLQDKPMMPVR